MFKRIIPAVTIAVIASLGLVATATPAQAHGGARSQVKQYECTWPCGWANVEGTVRWNRTHDVTRGQIDLVGGDAWVTNNNALYNVRVTVIRGNDTLAWQSSLRDFDKSQLPGIFIPPNYDSNGGYITITGTISFSFHPDREFSFTLPVE